MGLETTDRIETSVDARFHRISNLARIPLPPAGELDKYVEGLRQARETENRREIRRAATRLIRRLSRFYGVQPPTVAICGRRPHIRGFVYQGIGIVRLNQGKGTIIEETLGAYRTRRRSITIWIKTAAKGQTVAFRTLLVTLVHEFLHHLDCERLVILASPHTKAFYDREHRLYHRLLRERTASGRWIPTFVGTWSWVPERVRRKR